MKQKELKNQIPDSIIEYNNDTDSDLSFAIQNLTVDKAVKNWSFECDFPTCLAIFSNEEENTKRLVQSLVGYGAIIEGKILINTTEVTFNPVGFERKIAYVATQFQRWNKIFSIQRNLAKTAMSNKPFLQEVSNYNQKIKTDIENLKNTGLNIESGIFKEKLILIIKNFINETQTTRSNFIREYEYQTNHFHQNFVEEKFNFPGCETLAEILIKKFTSEEENIIANNNLLFLQSLQDRIYSLESLVGECFCGCNPPKERKYEFQLHEITFVIKEVNTYLNKKISNTRSEIRTTLKTCNNHNQSFNNELNHLLAYKQIAASRTQIDQVLEQWIDLAEVQRIKFNMKQDFVAMQLLPDEMHLLFKNIKDEIKIYHDKLLNNPKYQDKESYQNQLKELYSNLIDVRDLISKNIVMVFKALQLSDLLSARITHLSIVEKTVVKIVQQLIVPIKILILKNPFELLSYEDKEKLTNWIKILQNKLKIIIIFTTNSQVDITLLSTNVTVIENEIVIQQGDVGNITNKPLSLKLLKEVNKHHVNVSHGKYYNKMLVFYGINLGKFDLKEAPIIAFKASAVLVSLKKPRFAFFKNAVVIKSTIENITKVNKNESYLMLKTIKQELFEALVNNKLNFTVGMVCWISVTKNSIFIFENKTEHLVGTW